jgi:superkiller protein 3
MNGVGIIKSVWQDLIIRTKQVLEFPVEDLFFKKTVTEIAQSSEVIDWDEDIPLSAEESYQALRRALQRTKGFSLFFVRCSPIQGNHLIRNLKRDLQKKKTQTLMLEEETENLYDLVANLPKKQNTNILFIRGLEHSLLRYEEKESLGLSSPNESKVYGGTWAGIPRILGHLNLSRERFRDSFSIAFVFLLPEFALLYFIRRAPDFFDWRSGIYEFPTEQKSLNSETYRLLHRKDTDIEIYRTWTPQKRLQQLTEIRAYLSESPDPERSSQLWLEKGLIHAVNNQLEEAIISYDHALKLKSDLHEAWNNRGIALGNLGRLEEEISAYDNALKIKPDYYQARYNREIALKNLVKLAEEIAYYNKGLQSAPKDYHTLVSRGIVLGKLGRHKEAITSYDQALQINPNDAKALVNRGIMLRKLGQIEEAIYSYDEALKICLNGESCLDKFYSALHTLYFYHGNFGNLCGNLINIYYYKACAYAQLERIPLAVENLTQAINLDVILDAINLGSNILRIAETDTEFDKIRNDRRFIELINQINELKGDYHDAWYKRGDVLFTLGSNKEAIASYDNALKFKPDYHEAWYKRGVALFNLGKLKKAIASYSTALKFKPDYHEAWYDRGLALGNLGRFEEAISSFDNALKIKPDLHETWYKRGVALGNLGRYEEAISSLGKALKIKPDLDEAWFNRGISLGNLGKNEEAIASYDQALKIKPNLGEAWYNRGIALGNLVRYEEAISSFDKALKIKPNWGKAWYHRGVTLVNLGKNEDAITSFDNALKLKPDFYQSFYSKACVYALQENIDLALENLTQAINLDSKCLEMAKTDTDFDRIRNDRRFIDLINQSDSS